MAGEPLRIEMFGGLRALFGGRAVTKFRTQKTASLLAYLAHHRSFPHSRETLAGLLWPDDEPDAGRHSLRQSLTFLRQQLEQVGAPDGVLQADRGSVQLDPYLTMTDAAEFDAAVKQARRMEDTAEKARLLSNAAELYSGPFLAGFFEEWVTAEQNRFAETYLEVLRGLVPVLCQLGKVNDAVDIGLRAVAAEPSREEAHLALMTAYARAGRLEEVRRQYRELERKLAEDVGTRPSQSAKQETISLLQASVRSTPVPRHLVETAASQEQHTRPQTQPRIPVPVTRFFGREEELRQIVRWIAPNGEDGRRIVTLTGPGGSGKTRLAIEAAAGVAEDFTGRVWFVPLADLSDSTLIAGAVLETLGVPPSAASDPLAQIEETVGGGPALFVFDNLEHIMPGAADFVHVLISLLPALTCLITSRHKLSLGGEQELPTAPLPIPDQDGAMDRAASVASVRLFVDRARLARTDFAMSDSNAVAVTHVCRQLEGIPLAIELAAAWASSLTPAQMVERLESRFDLLVSKRRDVPRRHRTLRACVESSYRLLPDALQAFSHSLPSFAVAGRWKRRRPCA